MGKIVFLSSFIFASMLSTSLHGQTNEVKVAMAQIFSLDGDQAGNLVRIENAVIKAKDLRADIVAFPESCILGWLNADAHQRASAIPGTDSDKLCAIAKKYRIHIAIGLDEKDDEKLYGAAIFIDDNGNILLKHRKINVLTELMTPPYTSGNDVNTVDTKFGRIGMLICADSFQADLLARMKEKRPSLLIIPYGWAANENEWPGHGKELEKVVINAAKIVGCPTIGTDLVGEISGGPWKGKTYGGQSIAANQTGKVLGRGKDRDSDMILISVTTSRRQ